MRSPASRTRRVAMNVRARLVGQSRACTRHGQGRASARSVLRVRRALPELSGRNAARLRPAVARRRGRQGHQPLRAPAAVPAQPRRRRLFHRQALRRQPRSGRLGQRRCRERRRLSPAGEGTKPPRHPDGAAARHRSPTRACGGPGRGPAGRDRARQRADHRAHGRNSAPLHAARIASPRPTKGSTFRAARNT